MNNLEEDWRIFNRLECMIYHVADIEFCTNVGEDEEFLLRAFKGRYE